MTRALVFGTKTATCHFESGASVRVKNIADFLKESGFDVSTTSSKKMVADATSCWDLIVVVSHANASILRLARKHTQFLWFDSTDSFFTSRTSSIRMGEFKKLLLLMRELLHLRTSPALDLLTYVSKTDSLDDSFWLSHQNEALVFPLHSLGREIETTTNRRLVFIGDGSYRPNKLALIYISKVMKSYTLDYQVHVYGRGYKPLTGNFVFYGYSNQGSMYKSGDVHLAPRVAGAGINLKVAVPLANGLNVITNASGANGFLPNQALHVAQNHSEFAHLITDVMSSRIVPDPIRNTSSVLFKSDDMVSIRKMLSNLHKK